MLVSPSSDFQGALLEHVHLLHSLLLRVQNGLLSGDQVGFARVRWDEKPPESLTHLSLSLASLKLSDTKYTGW